MTTWTCALCHQSGGRNRNSSLCRECALDLLYRDRRWCNGCKRVVDVTDWYASDRQCRACRRARDAKYRRRPEIRERDRAAVAAWRERNPDYAAIQSRHWREQNHDHAIAYARARRRGFRIRKRA